MRVLVIGNGGKEHALILSLALSSHVKEIFCCPGNAGIEQIANCVQINIKDFEKIADFAKSNKIDLIIPLSIESICSGITDYLLEKKFRVFSPKLDSAKLDWSKYFAKEFMLRRGLPTAHYAAFERREHAIAYSYSRKLPIIIKTDGLTDGKGIAIVSSNEGAIGAINACFEGKFGNAGKLLIIEDYLDGTEIELTTICDGENYTLLPTAQNYKRLIDGNKGSNTAGMGAYSPHKIVNDNLIKQIQDKILQPLLMGMKEEGRPYKGFLSITAIINEKGEPMVIEFDCSIKDPIAQVVFPLLECDLFEVIWQATEGNLGYFKNRLPSTEISKSGVALSVVLASQGYPERIVTGLEIGFKIGCSICNYSQLIDEKEPEKDSKIILFQNETGIDKKSQLVTAGGRVFSITALSSNLKLAQNSAYKAINKINFAGKQYRRDIGA